MKLKKDRALFFLFRALMGVSVGSPRSCASGMQASGENVKYGQRLSKRLRKRTRTLTHSEMPKVLQRAPHLFLLCVSPARAPTTLISASFHANCIALRHRFLRALQQTAIADHPSVDAALQELNTQTNSMEDTNTFTLPAC